MKRNLVISLVSLCLLTNSVALAAQEAKQQTLKPIKGANQIIDEARRLLWSNAYRIDKELISTADSYGQGTTSYSISNSEEPTSSAGGRFMGGIVGGILGGSFAGLAGIITGVDPLASMGLAVAGSTGGAMIGGRDSSSSVKRSSRTSYSYSESHSRTYQIHEKANTWGILIMDVEGYEKAKEKIMNAATAQNSCVQQGIAFLDALKTYKLMDAKQINHLSTLLEQLQKVRTQQAILIDQGKGSQQMLTNIDAFTDQRVSAIRINWQNYLTETGRDCLASTDSQAQKQILEKQLIERFNNTSSFMSQNSMNQMGALSFSSAPYKKASQDEVAALSFVKTRAMINQVKTLKKLKDKGYIRFIRSGVSMSGDKSGGIVLEVTPKALKNINTFSSGIPYRVDQSATNSSYISAVYGVGYVALNILVAAVVEASSSTGNHAKSLFSIGLSSATLPATIVFSKTQSEKHNKEQAEESAKQILSDKSFNDNINKSILTTEEIYDLKNRPSYTQDRSSLISEYKNTLAHGIVKALIEDKNRTHWNGGLPYVEFLQSKGIVTPEEITTMTVILDFLSSKTIYLKDVDTAFILKNQMKSLQVSLGLILQDSNLTQDERKEISALKETLDREVQGLDLLKK